MPDRISMTYAVMRACINVTTCALIILRTAEIPWRFHFLAFFRGNRIFKTRTYHIYLLKFQLCTAHALGSSWNLLFSRLLKADTWPLIRKRAQLFRLAPKLRGNCLKVSTKRVPQLISIAWLFHRTTLNLLFAFYLRSANSLCSVFIFHKFPCTFRRAFHFLMDAFWESWRAFSPKETVVIYAHSASHFYLYELLARIVVFSLVYLF